MTEGGAWATAIRATSPKQGGKRTRGNRGSLELVLPQGLNSFGDLSGFPYNRVSREHQRGCDVNSSSSSNSNRKDIPDCRRGCGTLSGVTVGWIYERTRRKAIPHRKLGKSVRFTEEDCE